MLFIDLLSPLLLSISVNALPSTNHSILLSPNRLNSSSSVQAVPPVNVSPDSVRCYGAPQWIPLDVEDCEEVFDEMHDDPDFNVKRYYNFDHSIGINSWSDNACVIVAARDGRSHPPPHNIRFSTADIFRITLYTFAICHDQGHGGLADLGRGYYFSVGHPSRPRLKP